MTPDTIDDVIDRGRQTLRVAQDPRGGWDAEIAMGPCLVAAWAITMHHLGVLRPDQAEAASRALAAEQYADGSFPAHPRASSGDLATTKLCAAALRTLGHDVDAGQRAAAYVAREAPAHRDALERVSELQFSFLSLFLILADAIPGTALPRIPIEAALVPGVDALVDRRIHAGNIVALLTLIAVADARDASPRGFLRVAARAVARARIVGYLESQQNPDGSWNSTVIQTLTLLVGFAAAGLTAKDGRVLRALGFVDRHTAIRDGRLHLRPFHAEIWCTGHAMTALCDVENTPDDAIDRGVQYLVAVQTRTPQPRFTQPKRDAARTGGWPFEASNALLPDCDDTGVALEALGSARSDRREVTAAIRDGIAWLDAMQNPDGGWSAYVWGLPGKPPGPIYLDDVRVDMSAPTAWLKLLRDPPPELGDPSWEDVTGRVLSGLGACGLRRGDPRVERAIGFLAAQQCTTGAWWGRWIACYLPGTSCVLAGLVAVGVAPDEPMLQRAIAWLEGVQNDDGGWGEPTSVYREPQLAGRGPSNACATGMVVHALVRCGRADTAAVTRGVAYLCRSIDAEGRWPNDAFLHPLVPPDSHYEFGISAMVYPLRALGAYRRALGACRRALADRRGVVG
jgi:squalene-hopene/tetraprenyl-beta-curcumene cyclase